MVSLVRDIAGNLMSRRRPVDPAWDQPGVQGDEAQAVVTNGTACGTSGLPWLAVGVIGALLLAGALVNAYSAAHDAAQRGAAWNLGIPLFWEITSALATLALLPVLALLAVRLRHPVSRWRQAGTVLAAMLGFVVLHIGLMVTLRELAAGFRYRFAWTGANLLYEGRKDALTAVLLLAAFWLAVRRPVPARLPAAEREPEPSPADQPLPVPALWLRDGTTRIRVDPRDIVWVASAGNYVEYRLTGGVTHLIRATLQGEMPRLAPFGIVRVHRTRLVNLARVTAVEARPAGDFTLVMDTAEKLAGSRRYREAALGEPSGPAAQQGE